MLEENENKPSEAAENDEKLLELEENAGKPENSMRAIQRELDSAYWRFEEKQYPLFAFDKPVVIELPNGSKHRFKMWNETTEKRREDLLKTVVITSPIMINGENPREVKTDYTRSVLYYYEAMIDAISGVELNGNPITDWLDVRQLVGGEIGGRAATVLDYISAPIRKAAASRLYGGKIEIERLTDEDDLEIESLDEDDLTAQIERAEKKKELYQLSLERTVIVRQELGVEFKNGAPTAPKQIVRYHFAEPQGEHFSKWEMKAYRGKAISLNKGGERAERFYNLETVATLFDALVDRIEGATIGGETVQLPTDRADKRRLAILTQVPLLIKKLTVATLFAEMQNLGNS